MRLHLMNRKTHTRTHNKQLQLNKTKNIAKTKLIERKPLLDRPKLNRVS